MTISFMLFNFFVDVAIALPCWFLGLRMQRNSIRKNGKESMLAFIVAFGGMPVGLLVPVILTRAVIIPNYSTYAEYDLTEVREVEENGSVIQYAVYEDGTEINLTEKTGQYYTENPDTTLHREQCTFLWVVKWDQRWFTGLDFVDRN